MKSLLRGATLKSIISEENLLFLKQWLRNPAQMGACAPTSLKLALLVADQLNITNQTTVVEIGAATGRISQVLLEKGVDMNRLAMVDLSKTMTDFLKNLYNFKLPHVICGNAESLPAIIPPSWVKKVDYVVSTVPLMCMEEEARERVIRAALDIINPETGVIVHASYSSASPIKFMEGELVQRCVVSTWKNMPPGFIWRFSPKRYTHHLRNA